MRRIIQIAYAALIATLIGSVAYAQNPQLQLNQGSVTAGQQGNLTLGAVSPTTSTFATGTTMPFQIDTFGNLKVVATGVSVTVGGVALTTSQSQIGIVTVQSMPAVNVTVQNPSLTVTVGTQVVTMSTLSVANATGSNIIGYTSSEPCTQSAKLATPINAGSATQQLVATGASSKKIYVCSISFVAGSAVNFNMEEGTGSFCQTGTAAMMGSTIVTQGYSVATQGGLTFGAGIGTVALTATAADNVCIYVSPASQWGGSITYVQQ